MIRNSINNARGSRGWRGETYRHSLAARGVRTRPVARGGYYADYARAAERVKAIFHDGTPDVEGTDMRHMVVDNLRNEVRGELDKEMREGRMNFEDAQDFMDKDFTMETKHFLQTSKPDRESYEKEVRRRLERHKSMHNRKVFM